MQYSLGQLSGVFQVGLILTITFCVYLIHKVISKRLIVHFSKTPRNWDDAFFKAAGTPVNILIWVVGFFYSFYLIQEMYWPRSDALFWDSLFNVVFGVLLVWFFFRFIQNVQDNLIVVRPSGKTVDITTVYTLVKIAQLSASLFGALIVMSAFNVPISGLVAFGGGSALVVGIAAQALLANFFGSLIILLDKPFKVGDQIRISEKDIEGTVNYIGWRQTQLVTIHKHPLYVPNSIFTSGIVENLSRRNNRRIEKIVGIRYADNDKLEVITRDIRAKLRERNDLDTSLPFIVNFANFSPSSLDIAVTVYTKTTDWAEFHQVQQEVLLDVSRIIAKHGAEVAFPTVTVDLPGNLSLR